MVESTSAVYEIFEHVSVTEANLTLIHINNNEYHGQRHSLNDDNYA